MNQDLLRELISRWRDDPGATYRTWFLWEERLKNFRSIRRGLAEVVSEIEAGTFGNVYKGSSLETVVSSIAEQRQIFKGADHAFLWKPKLRIPDIYENPSNQQSFGRFLKTCSCCNAEEDVLAAIRTLDNCRIKGLGPAAANLLYFLHPTIVPPFNTAIVNGYNALMGAKVKLGKWDEYLALRDGMIRLNTQYRDLLSNDFGAVGGLLFDIGSNRYSPPPRDGDNLARQQWEADLQKVREENAKNVQQARENDRTHTEIQGWLRDLGRALNYQVWIAANDQGRPWGTGKLGDGCLTALPEMLCQHSGIDAVRLIDVLWFDPDSNQVIAAYEVEHTTSIYSGIVRLLDLAFGSENPATHSLYLVAPDGREEEVRVQLRRPAFQQIANLEVRYLPYSELEQHRESIARFGQGMKAIRAISRPMP